VDSETKPVESFVGMKGMISNGKGTETDVTFSLYCSQVYKYGEPVDVVADGFCRVSNESDVLDELFNDGTAVFLSSDGLEADIKLTSPGAFTVIGQILKK
jgi:hypothetical protein